jgi:uncharacterized protein (TIGR00369 family)
MKYKDLLESWQAGGDLAPVTRFLGVRPLSIGEGTVRLAMSTTDSHLNPFGTVHGGLIAAFADIALGCAMATRLLDDEVFATAQQNITFLQPVRECQLECTASIVQRTRVTGYVECQIFDASAQPVAHASCVCIIRKHSPADIAAGVR